jgi:hypothetical protein
VRCSVALAVAVAINVVINVVVILSSSRSLSFLVALSLARAGSKQRDHQQMFVQESSICPSLITSTGLQPWSDYSVVHPARTLPQRRPTSIRRACILPSRRRRRRIRRRRRVWRSIRMIMGGIEVVGLRGRGRVRSWTHLGRARLAPRTRRRGARTRTRSSRYKPIRRQWTWTS